MMQKIQSALLALGFCLAAASAYADSPLPIVIANSGSTNSAGYRISVMPNGAASYEDDGNGSKQSTLPVDLAQKLFRDMKAAQPLTQIRAGGCAKSASFGTRTTMSYGVDQSPDISCGGNAAVAQLYQDVQAVEKAMNVGMVPRRRITRPMM